MEFWGWLKSNWGWIPAIILIAAASGLNGVNFTIANSLADKLSEDSANATLIVGFYAVSIAIISLLVSLCALFVHHLSSTKMVQNEHNNAKATVTFQHIADTQSDHDMIAARDKVRQLEESEEQVSVYATVAKQAEEDGKCINLVLNDLELVSIGIQRGIIDCALFRSWAERSVVNKWRKWEPYAVQLRQVLNAPKLFVELEKMALAWDEARPAYKLDPKSPFNCP